MNVESTLQVYVVLLVLVRNTRETTTQLNLRFDSHLETTQECLLIFSVVEPFHQGLVGVDLSFELTISPLNRINELKIAIFIQRAHTS